ncbi:MAG: hypothetical protein RIR95_250 [Pseudomonadota bacterium]
MAAQSVSIGQINPVTRMIQAGAEPARSLSSREKAAIIVRFLVAEGAPLAITSLSEDTQAALTYQIGQMRSVDRTTLSKVIDEFLTELEDVGVSFPGGVEGALSLMTTHISSNAATKLRRLAGSNSKADPWERLILLPIEQLLQVLVDESVEVAAVVLSKLPVARSAELLNKLTGERARRVAYAVSLTGNVDPQTVQRIGQSLASQLDNVPLKAFESGPVERIGAILNVSAALTRDNVLTGLDETDQVFADSVRKAIFTFIHIPKRLAARDVPKLIRVADPPALITALTYCAANHEYEACAGHILGNISQRMAQGLREEIDARGKVKEKDAEEAMTSIILTIRQMEGVGEITLKTDEEDE